MSKLKTTLLLITGLLFSCRDDASTEVAPSPAKTYFISATKTSEISLESLHSLVTSFGQKKVADLLKYGVKSYTLVYRTTYNSQPIEASGLLLIPSGITAAAPIISLQHGTTFEKDDAPSTAGSYTGMELFASAGYIALVPDFIGYGSSSSVFHPYYDKEHSAMAVVDMIKSVKEFLVKEKVEFNDQLFLAGYSEGGYVTLAAAEEIENDPVHDLRLTAVAAGAGGYDLTEMLKGITTNTYYSYPSYLAFVLMSYNITYGWNKPLTDFFKPQYADSVAKYLNGEYGGGYINSRLTTEVTALFNADFYNGLKQSDQETQLKDALEKNSITGWKTNLPIRLYHGVNDEIIPYQNSEKTLQSFQSAASPNVSLKLIPRGTHGSSFIPMLEDFVPWFMDMNKK